MAFDVFRCSISLVRLTPVIFEHYAEVIEDIHGVSLFLYSPPTLVHEQTTPLSKSTNKSKIIIDTSICANYISFLRLI